MTTALWLLITPLTSSTSVTWRVPHWRIVKQELLSLPENLNPLQFYEDRVTLSLVFYLVLCPFSFTRCIVYRTSNYGFLFKGPEQYSQSRLKFSMHEVEEELV